MQPAGRIAPQPWMKAPATRAVFDALGATGATARFVGGCVRDALIGRAITDIDIATDAVPDATIAALREAGIKAVPTGLQHGTVTAVADGRPFEVTTLRRDVSTDGRHAEVAFTDDWRADAARRDFTFNALFLDPDGAYYDFFDGVPDLQAGRVRFVGDPAARIAEDYLRIMRFFRFFAHYGQLAPDKAVLSVCRDAAPGLQRLSAERVRDETLKLLAAPDPVAAWSYMQSVGVIACWYPRLTDHRRLARLCSIEEAIGRRDTLRRLAALDSGDAAQGRELAERLRLSNQQRDRLAAMLAPLDGFSVGVSDKALRVFVYRRGRQRVVDQLLLRAAEAGFVDLSRLLPRIEWAENWQIPVLPVTGRDALNCGVPHGTAVGRALAAVEAWWEAHDFAPDREACLARLRALAEVG